MSTPQDPFAPPGDENAQPPAGPPAQPPSHGQPTEPPAYGAQPPAYGAQPPAYGAQPSAYGAQPPAYGAQPSAYGSQPYGQPPAYGQGAYGQDYPPAYGVQSYPRNALAVWSLVLACLSFVCLGFLSAIPAVVLGHMSLAANKQGLANNRGLAIAGTVVGWVGLVLSVLGTIVFFAGGGWDAVMESWEQA